MAETTVKQDAKNYYDSVKGNVATIKEEVLTLVSVCGEIIRKAGHPAIGLTFLVAFLEMPLKMLGVNYSLIEEYVKVCQMIGVSNPWAQVGIGAIGLYAWVKKIKK